MKERNNAVLVRINNNMVGYNMVNSNMVNNNMITMWLNRGVLLTRGDGIFCTLNGSLK